MSLCFEDEGIYTLSGGLLGLAGNAREVPRRPCQRVVSESRVDGLRTARPNPTKISARQGRNESGNDHSAAPPSHHNPEACCSERFVKGVPELLCGVGLAQNPKAFVRRNLS